jgi:DNA-directed RNA polymerase subunit RPC12/RpoP
MQIEYCDTCKKKLTEQDFADGHAIRAGNQPYCKECGSKVPQVPVVPRRGPGASGTRLSSPSTGVIRRTATPAPALRPPTSVGVGATHRPGSPPKGMAPTSPPKGVTHMSPPAGVNRTIAPQQGQARSSSGTQHAANARPGSGGHARRSSPHTRVVGIAKPSGNTAMVWVSVIGVIVGVLAGVGIIALFLRH